MKVLDGEGSALAVGLDVVELKDARFRKAARRWTTLAGFRGRGGTKERAPSPVVIWHVWHPAAMSAGVPIALVDSKAYRGELVIADLWPVPAGGCHKPRLSPSVRMGCAALLALAYTH